MSATEFEMMEAESIFNSSLRAESSSLITTPDTQTPISASPYSQSTANFSQNITPIHSQIPPPINIEPGNVRMLQTYHQPPTIPILCCLCGASTQPNPSRMCIECLSSEVDITEGISKTIVIPNCRDCKRFLFHRWVSCEPESKELLTYCLKRIRGLSNVRLTNANFIWTEPHSKRIKIKLTIQKELINNAIIQHAFIVEFVIQSAQCDQCKRLWTPHTWNARVQLRQRANHKRTFLYLEQIILKHDAHENVINIVNQPDGLDFQFISRNHAQKFVDFVSSIFPIKSRISKELISHNANSNSYYHKYSFCSEICPICKDDIVWLPSKVSSLYGGISPLLICYGLTTSIHLVDPFTLQSLDIVSEKYWKNPFESILSRNNLSEFIILDFELFDNGNYTRPNHSCKKLVGKKYRLAHCEIARASDFGYNNETLRAVCYLGNQIRVGDWWLGYDFSSLNFSGHNEKVGRFSDNLPCEVILAKRSNSKNKGLSKKPWKLQWLTKQSDDNTNLNAIKDQKDMEEFENDLAENVEYRKNVNLFRDPTFDYDQFFQNIQLESDAEDNFTIEELMEALTLNENATGDDIYDEKDL